MLGNKRMTNRDGMYAAMSLVLLGSLVAAMVMPDGEPLASADGNHAEAPLVTVVQPELATVTQATPDNQQVLTQMREDAAEVMARLQQLNERRQGETQSGAVRSPYNLQQYRAVEVVATGYTAGYESTGKNPDHPQYGITYSGVKVRRDHVSTIAADLSVFPLGTLLWIPDYGYGIVADIGGAIKGNKIDLYFENTDDVYAQWGKKTLDVYIIEPGEGEMNEQILAMKLADVVD